MENNVPTAGSMIRRVIQLPLLLPFFLLSCKWLDATGASITVQNQTDKPIMVLDFSPLEEAPSFPVEIAAYAEYVFKSGRFPEGYTFTVEIDGKCYGSETRYVQDWRRFSIVFAPSESETGIVCTIDKDGRVLELKEIAGNGGA
ncbi:MAG: hypothetical protein HDR32_04375 [Treponema sp.]|nr:hypothetical protein [Treponema sp.]